MSSSTTSDSCAAVPADCPVLEPVPTARVVGRRSPGGILEAFRRRSKSDSKSSSSLDIAAGHSRPSSSTGRGSHRGLMSTIKSHMPWTDKRSSSIDSSSITNQQQHNASGSSSHSTAREQGFHALASHLSPVAHMSNDPYFTYTYGQDPRYSRRSGSVTRTVMDIFKRSDSLHNNNKRSGIAGLDCSPDEQHLVFVKFFKHYRCYDLIPVSAKLIVLDTQLIVKKAFHALVSNGMSACSFFLSNFPSLSICFSRLLPFTPAPAAASISAHFFVYHTSLALVSAFVLSADLRSLRLLRCENRSACGSTVGCECTWLHWNAHHHRLHKHPADLLQDSVPQNGGNRGTEARKVEK